MVPLRENGEEVDPRLITCPDDQGLNTGNIHLAII